MSSSQRMLLEVLDRLTTSVDSLREETQQQNSNLERKIDCLSQAVFGLFELVSQLAEHQEKVAGMFSDYVQSQIIKEVFKECPPDQ